MRFLRRVLRASASAGDNSSLRNSTLPFLPLRTLPSASAFSVRLAESRAAISPGDGLTAAGAATAALPPLPFAFEIAFAALAPGLSGTCLADDETGLPEVFPAA